MALVDVMAKETPFILLDSVKNKNDIIKLMGLDKYLDKRVEKLYARSICQYKGNYYYFKDGGKDFPCVFNELLGEALSENLEIESVRYLIAKYDDSFGIASKNFRDLEHFDYYFIDDLKPNISRGTNGFDTINFLKEMCIDLNNQEHLLENIFKLLSIDVYMLQRDRHIRNLQFKINKETNYFDLAPLYDFGLCNDIVYGSYVMLFHVILNLCADNLIPLRKKYPLFGDILKETSEIDIVYVMESIAKNYHLKTDCRSFQNVLDYYEIKKKNQKRYMKKLLD